jgi:hypothetical protein
MKKIFHIIAIGVGATLVMDVWSIFLKLFGIKGLNMGHLGHWLLSLVQLSLPQSETVIGWMAHYLIGVIFCFLLVSVYGFNWVEKPTLKPALIIGMVTVLAPLLILQPALGLGYFASNSPSPIFSVFKSCVTHLVYGLGLYLSAKLIPT